MIEKLKEHFKSIPKDAIPQLSVNCVIFGFKDKQLQVIVNEIEVESEKITVLPGGFIKQSEDLTETVERVVLESTGLSDILFRQFAVFGKADRSFAAEFNKASWLEQEKELIEWVSGRFISICYLALVDASNIDLKPTQFLEAASWLPVNSGEILAMDHSEILDNARDYLIRSLPHEPIESNLLTHEFTLPELHALVEAILNRSIDRPNFRRKILKSDRIEKVGVDATGKRRPADLYRFKEGNNTNVIQAFRLGF
ncbi:MAG: NUDIX domain-containing protein [Cytophagales bacterium]|nr:NUDIX domain-containing protein [Cytophagales bacterium]